MNKKQSTQHPAAPDNERTNLRSTVSSDDPESYHCPSPSLVHRKRMHGQRGQMR